jgi:hypothetical protein
LSRLFLSFCFYPSFCQHGLQTQADSPPNRRIHLQSFR